MKLARFVLPFGRSRLVRSSACTALPGLFRHAAPLVPGTGVNAVLLALAAAAVLAASPAKGVNVLVNPGFESPPSGQVVPTGWTYFAPPTLGANVHDYWVAGPLDYGASAHSGTFFWKQWGALYAAPPINNVAGIAQTFSSAPGSIYTASGWFYSKSTDAGGLGADCLTWIEVAFLGASSNVLALYKSPNFSASVGLDAWFPYSLTDACDLSQPVSIGDPYFTTYAVTGSVSQLVAPLGTTAVRYRYAFLQGGREGGSAVLDDAVLNQISGPILPVITQQPQSLTVTNGNPASFTISETPSLQ